MAFEFLKRLVAADANKPAIARQSTLSGEDYVTASVISVGMLFSDQSSLRLPWFQRAYAWREEHAGRLLSDLHEAMVSPKRRYFLGTIRIATGDDAGTVSLIDGQQRLVTLTILFALVRDLAISPATKSRADRAVRLDGREGYRVVPQPSLASFFAARVQDPDGSLLDHDSNGGFLAEGERYVLENRNHLRSKLLDMMPEEEQRAEFLGFILERCFVLVVGVEDEDEAWAMLAIDEETGLAFHSSERSKLSLIAVMKPEEQEDAGRVWDHCQRLVGADDLGQLLRHVRAIKQRRRSSRPIEKDLAQAFTLNRDGLRFLDTELLVRAKAFAQVRALSIGGPDERAQIGHRLKTLFWLDCQYWVPPVLRWLEVRGSEHEDTRCFIEGIERLAWMLRLAGADSTEQERRFMAVMGDIDTGTPPAEMQNLALGGRLPRSAVSKLSSRTFYSKHYSGLVLRLLSTRLGNDPGQVNRASLTIEHVLPRNPAAGSNWRRTFSSTDIAECVNRLGNLVLLADETNQAAGTHDYDVKRQLMSESGLVLAQQAAREHVEWTKEVIMARTERMIDVLLDDWDVERASAPKLKKRR